MRPFLKGARNDFLDESNNEKLSTTSTECRLNITARKAPTYAILERLDQHLKNVQHRMLPIGQLTKHIPSSAELEELARITSTSLKLHKQGKDAVCHLTLNTMLSHADNNEGTSSLVVLRAKGPHHRTSSSKRRQGGYRPSTTNHPPKSRPRRKGRVYSFIGTYQWHWWHLCGLQPRAKEHGMEG